MKKRQTWKTGTFSIPKVILLNVFFSVSFTSFPPTSGCQIVITSEFIFCQVLFCLFLFPSSLYLLICLFSLPFSTCNLVSFWISVLRHLLFSLISQLIKVHLLLVYLSAYKRCFFFPSTTNNADDTYDHYFLKFLGFVFECDRILSWSAMFKGLILYCFQTLYNSF